jgi:hypothetical protein
MQVIAARIARLQKTVIPGQKACVNLPFALNRFLRGGGGFDAQSSKAVKRRTHTDVAKNA